MYEGAHGTLSAKNGIWKGKGLDIRTEPFRINFVGWHPGLPFYIKTVLDFTSLGSHPNLASRAVVRNNCICYGRYVLNWGKRRGGGGPGYFPNFWRKKGRIYEEQKGGNLLVMNIMNSWGPIEQFVAIVAACRLNILERMPAPLLKSVLRHQEDCTSGVEQVAEQLQKSGKIWRPREVPQPKGPITTNKLNSP